MHPLGAFDQHELPISYRHLRTTERRAALLDREQVGEVGVGVQFQGHHGGFAVEVGQRYRLAQAVGHQPLAHHQQRAVGQPDARRATQDELRRKGLRELH